MTRRDPSGNPLPARMHFSRGSYFHVATNKWTALGKRYQDALRAWAAIETAGPARTVAQACEAYLAERGPELAPRTLAGYSSSMRRVIEVFGPCLLGEVYPPDVKLWLRRRSAAVSANRDKAFLSAVYSHAISEGWCRENPARGIRRRTERPRTRTIGPTEAWALLGVASPLWRALLRIYLLTGMRPGELRELPRAALTEAGIDLSRSKTGAVTLIEWTPALRDAIRCALAAAPRSDYVFPARHGGPYALDAFSRAWARLCAAAGVAGL